MHNPLAHSLINLAGIGEKTAEALAKSQVYSLFDLLLHVPKSIVEQIEAPNLTHLEAGRHYVICGKVVGVKVSGRRQKQRLEAILQDETGRMSVVFFGNAVTYAQQILKDQAIVTLSGEAKNFLGRIQMVHPKVLMKGAPKAASLPTYAQMSGINSAMFKRIIDKAITLLRNDDKPDHIDALLLKSHKLAPLKQALIAIHELKEIHTNWDERKHSPYFRRLAFEEILSFYLRLNLQRGQIERKCASTLKQVAIADLVQDFLPFSLTGAQTRVASEIIEDMAKPQAMTRLLQGDVGSGKTAVSALAALHVAMAGLQTAVMAPTEILAEQLFQVYQSFFTKKPFRLGLMTASTKAKERKRLLEQIDANEITVVIGTHALLSNELKFNRLGLVIVDEQHRFGVKQRCDLLTSCADTQGFCPHLLVMSATPIPRSLALTMYGDLDLSVIDERPLGRIPIHTQMFSGPVLPTLERLCERILLTHQKAFIVFPLVEESEHLDLENATKAVAFLHNKFGQDKAMLLHGKMRTEEKTTAMNKFREHAISFLVATTVVEVGIDIPDATCMIIIHPERFGLAQLHQLRGRVGRKDLKSFCFLVTDIGHKFGTAYKRLDALCKTDNGFKLAEIDLEIRGPGEILGVKQSGLPQFHIFSHSEFGDLITPAKNYAKSIAEQGVKLEHHHLYLNKEARFC